MKLTKKIMQKLDEKKGKKSKIEMDTFDQKMLDRLKKEVVSSASEAVKKEGYKIKDKEKFGISVFNAYISNSISEVDDQQTEMDVFETLLIADLVTAKIVSE